MTKDTLHVEKRTNTFHDWVIGNKHLIEQALLSSACDFLSECSEEEFLISNLQLTNQWQYLDRKQTKGYNGSLFTNANGVPHLKLTYHSFKHGGESHTFNSKQVLQSLWKNEREGKAGQTFKHIVVKKKKAQIHTPKIIENKIKEDLELWDNLSSTGTSHYLKRKKVSSEIEIKGLKFGHNLVAVKIVNIEGRAQGLQKIYNDGKKLFTKGLEKKGNFALIGADKLNANTKQISICEGVSTALSIFMATGEPVCSALDAFNLLPVAKKIKRKHTKAKLVFWADNDAHKADKLKPNGEKIGNTGLIHAHLAALKMRNAKVMVPEFKDLTFDEALKPTDFNDLHCIAGLSALNKIKPQKPNLNFALTKALLKNRKKVHQTLSAHNFQKATNTELNERYLPSDLTIKKGVNLIRSPIGTGKTQAVEALLNNNPNFSVLFTTHLISLVESGANRLGLASYNKCDGFDLQMERRLAICLNSLGKLTLEGPIPRYDVLVIDEVEQVLSRLTNPLENKTLIFRVLKHLIENAKYVVCLDAHLSQSTVSMVKRWVSEKVVNIYLNTYQSGQDKEIKLYEDKESLQIKTIQTLKENKNAYLTFNSKTEASKTFELIKHTLPTKKGLFISGDNTGEKDNVAFFSDVNTVSKKYDYLICTPSVSTGVSISNHHFDFVAGFFNTNINTANDCCQALGRVRDMKINHVFCETRRADKPLDPKVIASRWRETHKHDLKLMNINEEGRAVLFNEDYENLTIEKTILKNQSFNNFFEEFALLMLDDGFKLSYADFVLESEEKKLVRETKNQYFELTQLNAIQKVETLSETDIQKLAKKPRKTLQETLSFEKQKIMEFFGVKDETTLMILFKEDKQGRLRKKILSMELALSSKELAVSLYKKQYEEFPQFAADLKHYATEQELFHKLLNEVGIVFENSELINKQKIYNKETLIQSDFLAWIKQNYQKLSGIFSLPHLNSFTHSPLRAISFLLDKVGLKQKRVGKNENGTYQIDESQFLFVKSILQKRGKIEKGDTQNIQYINTALAVPESKKQDIETKQSTNNSQNLLDKLQKLLGQNKMASVTNDLLQEMLNKLKSAFQIDTNSTKSNVADALFEPQLFVP